jgi:endonuclease-8
MPEGDTLHRVAARLRPALAGRQLTRFEAQRLWGERPRAGDRIEGVEARGKHLLVHFAGGLTLRTHLRMNGSWHLYAPGERWRRPRGQVRVAIEVEGGWQAVCFAAPDVETYRRTATGGPGTAPPVLDALGPDLCQPDIDLGVVLARLSTTPSPDAEVGEVLLDQRVASGIGNVYKSEVCFACRLDPFTPLAELGEADRRRVYEVAHRMLRANLGAGPRRTHPGPGGVAVYRRPGRPCPRCGTAISVTRQGPYARATYWCPGCQVRPAVEPGNRG